jgi:hypothetical protein
MPPKWWALIVAVPVAVATARAIGWGWSPGGDEGVIAARSFDVLTTHPPLLGQYSQVSDLVGHPTYALGPLLYWVLALPAHLGSAALVLAMGALNAAAVVATVLLAGRRGGFVLAVATALGLVAAMHSLPLEAAYAIWNPYAAVFPLTLLLFVAWSVACGEHRLVPVLVVLASFVAQAHLTYVIPAAGCVVVAVGGLATRWSPDVRRWLMIAAVAGAVCWSAPIVEQVLHRPGNLVLVGRSVVADRETLGPRAGWHAVVRTIGVPPWWLRGPQDRPRVIDDVRGSPGALATGSALLVLAAVLAVLAVALARRRYDLAAPAALSLVVCASVAASMGVPTGQLPALVYSLRWASLGGMWVWLTTAWAAWALLGAGRRLPSVRPVAVRWAALAAVGVAVVWAVADQERRTGGLSLAPEHADAADDVAEALRDGVTARIATPDDDRGRVVAPAIAYALRRDGSRVLVPNAYANYFGARYIASSAEPEVMVGIGPPDAPAPAGTRLVGRYPPLARITVGPPPAP